MKLALNENELDLIRTLISREERRVARLTGKQKQAKSSTVIVDLHEKLKGQTYNQDFEGNRNDFRALEKALGNFRIHIQTQSLPEYDRRIQKYPEFAVKYNEYVAKEEAQLDLVCDLIIRIEKELRKAK